MRQRNRRQRRAPGRENSDRWMITYADLITLLLIFFVILYAMSSLDTQKYAIVTDSLSDTFKSGSAVLEGGNGLLDGSKGNDGAADSKDPEKGGSSSAGQPAGGSGQNGTAAGTPRPDSRRIRRSISLRRASLLFVSRRRSWLTLWV